MSCPDCGCSDVDLIKQDTDFNGFEIEEYVCNECGCEYEWTMQRVILTHGKVQDE